MIYESEASMDTPDRVRFGSSCILLNQAGIPVLRVLCSSETDVPDGDIRDSYESGSLLPAADYDGVAVCVGRYPTDRELANYLDVPHGVLSVDRTRVPPMANDMMPHCFIRPRTF